MPGILISKPVMLAYLYGSTADGSRLPFSDVDIALVLEPDCPLSAYERMKLELDIAAEVGRLCDNRLVHLYWEIDAEIIYEILQKNLGGLVKSRHSGGNRSPENF